MTLVTNRSSLAIIITVFNIVTDIVNIIDIFNDIGSDIIDTVTYNAVRISQQFLF